MAETMSEKARDEWRRITDYARLETTRRNVGLSVTAGTLAEVNVRGELVRSVPVNDPLAAGAVQLPMKAASPIT